MSNSKDGPICPICHHSMALELQPSGMPPRTFQCLNCERPDPMKSPVVASIFAAAAEIGALGLSTAWASSIEPVGNRSAWPPVRKMEEPRQPTGLEGGPSLGQGLARLDWGRPSACRYFHGHAIEPMRCARDRSRVNWLSISSMSTFSRSLASLFLPSLVVIRGSDEMKLKQS
jgi:hypothetical protein